MHMHWHLEQFNVVVVVVVAIMIFLIVIFTQTAAFTPRVYVQSTSIAAMTTALPLDTHSFLLY